MLGVSALASVFAVFLSAPAENQYRLPPETAISLSLPPEESAAPVTPTPALRLAELSPQVFSSVAVVPLQTPEAPAESTVTAPPLQALETHVALLPGTLDPVTGEDTRPETGGPEADPSEAAESETRPPKPTRAPRGKKLRTAAIPYDQGRVELAKARDEMRKHATTQEKRKALDPGT
ncbi:MAG: hypothetical protein ISR48_06130 [Alphaproteobacteria bacterium]|nr:hypothetical protein [Alphaproteobacteria bacterium]